VWALIEKSLFDDSGPALDSVNKFALSYTTLLQLGLWTPVLPKLIKRELVYLWSDPGDCFGI
jgi:hypothetical protein